MNGVAAIFGAFVLVIGLINGNYIPGAITAGAYIIAAALIADAIVTKKRAD